MSRGVSAHPCITSTLILQLSCCTNRLAQDTHVCYHAKQRQITRMKMPDHVKHYNVPQQLYRCHRSGTFISLVTTSSSVQIMTAIPSDVTNCAPSTTEIPVSEKRKGETAPRRNSKYLSTLRSPPDGVDTACNVRRRSDHESGDAKAFGKRRLIRSHKETNWIIYELSGYEYFFFNDFEQLALNAGKAFRALALQPRRARAHMVGTIHPNWLATAHGAMSQRLVLVTAYDSLAAGSPAHVIQETRPMAMFVDKNLLANTQPCGKSAECSYYHLQ